jgi:hypothetical protein
MMSNETLSMLANLIARYYVDSDSMGFYFPDELREELKGARLSGELIFNKLADLNISSLTQRYNYYRDMIDDVEYDPHCDMWKRPVWDNEYGIIRIEQWHYQFLKSLRCYLYQSCEGDCYESKLYKALDQLSLELAYFIATNQPEYELANWD